ncbi:transposase [Bosea sp. NPDC055594]
MSTAQAIANWVRQADRDASLRSDGATAIEREGLIRLRRESQRLRQERDILSKAAAWFARESKANTTTPSLVCLSTTGSR